MRLAAPARWSASVSLLQLPFVAAHAFAVLNIPTRLCACGQTLCLAFRSQIFPQLKDAIRSTFPPLSTRSKASLPPKWATVTILTRCGPMLTFFAKSPLSCRKWT